MSYDTSQADHEAFTLQSYTYIYTKELRAVRSGLSDAAHMCDSIANDIRKEHTVKLGRKVGQVSDVGEVMAMAVKRAGDAIWAMREKIAP